MSDDLYTLIGYQVEVTADWRRRRAEYVDEIEGDKIADTFIKLGRAFEIAEQESKAQDLEALADGERVGPVDIAEGAKRSGAAMYAACFSRRGLPLRDEAAVAAGPDVIR